MLRRRSFLCSAGSATLLGALGLAGQRSFGETIVRSGTESALGALEASAGGRLGVFIRDTTTGSDYGYRADERFLMLSSFKVLAVALVLHRVDSGLESLERRIRYTRKDLIPWSPITQHHTDGKGMTLAQLCEATLTTSDNTAANLILSSYGGPAALTNYLRRLGDGITQLNRKEPELNVRHQDASFDTTTPRAMLGDLHQLLVGEQLSPASRELLQRWMLNNTTGDKRLKAALPPDWRIGDKTGTNQTDANDVGIIWPPQRAPLLVVAYLAESPADGATKDATIAAVGRIVRDLVA